MGRMPNEETNEMHPFVMRRRAVLGAGLCLVGTVPLRAFAQSSEWEFFEPRVREYSRMRRLVPATMAIEFSGRRVETGAWPSLTTDEQSAVRKVQPPPLQAADEPAYPRLGLKPLVERLRVVRGPVGQPLRIYLQIDEYGAPERIAIDGKVPQVFASQMLGLLQDAAFKPGTCDGKPCTRVFAMDIVYLGDTM